MDTGTGYSLLCADGGGLLPLDECEILPVDHLLHLFALTSSRTTSNLHGPWSQLSPSISCRVQSEPQTSSHYPLRQVGCPNKLWLGNAGNSDYYNQLHRHSRGTVVQLCSTRCTKLLFVGGDDLLNISLSSSVLFPHNFSYFKYKRTFFVTVSYEK